MKRLLPILTLTLLLAACENQTSTPLTSVTVPHNPSTPTSTEPATMPEKIEKTAAEWKSTLTPQQFLVLRQKHTERAFTGEYDEKFDHGTYACAACGAELFTSETKFNSGCGWPAFYAAKAGNTVKLTREPAPDTRTEVTCARCDSHLGHIFDDAPQTPTGQRYCINSVSLKFIPAAATPKK